MKMKKLAIASAIALLGMNAAYAQSTPTESASTGDEVGLMTSLSNSLGTLFNTGNFAEVPEVIGKPDTYVAYSSEGADDGKLKYVLDINGTYRPANADELADTTTPLPTFYKLVPGVTAAAKIEARTNVSLADITALAGAVNLSTINGSIDISGTNVSITGISGDVAAKAEALGTTASSTAFAINGNNFSTTVIGAMNSSTLDIMARTVDLSEMTKSTLNIAALANQGVAPSITTQSFGPADLGLATDGSTILQGAAGDTQFNMEDLVSGTETLAKSTTEDLQSMNVFNMALNMAPIVAGVKIAADRDPNAWFLNPQTGIVNVSNLQIATTAIGAMNSSITHLGKNLTTLAK